ncbi:uncharacterized protein BDZ99DRAFT_575954 [Mytilinidion resinicola]|uniref:Uncharacterized protein n=1 Tax=Mytilinidion resinicola TaxID=574789 RepID=A0A6A6Y493_9PEZI|nr:uncharacterized protein BDZ99DRAFT_575954 [Mytilinidion resinicola]KAF2803449.1 hypothetical protein BDZ99DRAFT_575954 [Mytilinidion resinicola]
MATALPKDPSAGSISHEVEEASTPLTHGVLLLSRRLPQRFQDASTHPVYSTHDPGNTPMNTVEEEQSVLRTVKSASHIQASLQPHRRSATGCRPTSVRLLAESRMRPQRELVSASQPLIGRQRVKLHEQAGRLTLVLSALSLPTHLLSAIALQHLPTDPLHLGLNFSLYCIWAAALSFLGLVGAVKRSPSLTTIFSHHLLLDALISTIPRLLLPAFASLPRTLCAGIEYQRTILPPRDAEQMLGFWTAERCRASLWVLQIVIGLVVVAMTGVQWWCALRVRGYAKFLEFEGGRKSGKGRVRSVDEEKGRAGRRVRFVDEVEVDGEKGGVGWEEDTRRTRLMCADMRMK